MLASISAPAPPAPTLTPLAPAPAPSGDDEILGEEDLDLVDF